MRTLIIEYQLSESGRQEPIATKMRPISKDTYVTQLLSFHFGPALCGSKRRPACPARTIKSRFFDATLRPAWN